MRRETSPRNLTRQAGAGVRTEHHRTCNSTDHTTYHKATITTMRVKASLFGSKGQWNNDFRDTTAHKCGNRLWLFFLSLMGLMSVASCSAVAEPPAKPKHWAFQPVVRPEIPAAGGTREAGPPAARQWVRTPIDYFILAKLESQKLAPAPEADRTTLIRRLYLDLVGLLPMPEEVDAFVADKSPEAYEKLVEKLLASPHYGERWGRHWLDVARYADSNGYSIDAARSIWPYRDWVINALNRDMPFDEFVIEQMAGDLLPKAAPEQIVATGFHRNTPINQEGGIDLEQFRVDSIYDRLNTTGAAILGLTVGCAQCHDHKFDPLKQREYYQLFAFLNNDDEPNLELGTPQQIALKKKIDKERKPLEKIFKPLDKIDDTVVIAWQGKLTPEMRAKLPREIDHLLTIAENGRDEQQRDTLVAFVRNLDKTRHAVGGLMQSPLTSLLHVHLHLTRDRIEKRLAELKAQDPQAPTTMVLKQAKTPRETHVHVGGDFTRPGKSVDPGVPAWLGCKPPAGKSRLDLAKWLVDPAQPLTPRVMVNRLWQGHFGLGLVETENDFGTQGTPPSHPELLEWLASEFVKPSDVKASAWSLKHIHRLIVSSATYRQSSKARPELATIDPRNRLLARMPRLRLDAEIVRDAGLCASGLLNPKIGGPSVFPPQPDGVFRFTQVPRVWKADVGPDRYRRGMYTYFWRSAPHPSLVAFDAPDGVNACTRRNRSNTPLQALTLLNDEAFIEMAKGLVTRIEREGLTNDSERLMRAFRLCLGRAPTEREQSRLMKLQGDAGWIATARVLMNLDEFITRE
jgi:hypothetical protein